MWHSHASQGGLKFQSKQQPTYRDGHSSNFPEIEMEKVY